MAIQDPTKAEYLAVVNDWSSYGQRGLELLGQAYPIFCVSRGKAVADPLVEFPDPGYVFLLKRGSLVSWDFVRLRPGHNYQHTEGKARYISGQPLLLEEPGPDHRFATLLEVPRFDPVTTPSRLLNPLQNVTPIFFVRSERGIFGPMRRLQVHRTGYERLDSIQWAPHDPDSVIYEFTAEDLRKCGIELTTYKHPNADLSDVIRQPIHMLVGPVMSANSPKVHDRLPDTQLAEWYLRWRSLPDVPEPLLKTFQAASEHLTESSPEIIRRRCERLQKVFATLDVLQVERNAAIRKFLESEDGKKLIEQQLGREVERRAQVLQPEPSKRPVTLTDDKQRQAGRLQAQQDQQQQTIEALKKQVADLEVRRSDLSKACGSLDAQLQAGAQQLAAKLKDQVPLLAAMTLGMRPSAAYANGPVIDSSPAATADAPGVWNQVAVPRPSKELAEVTREEEVIDHLEDELTREALCFNRDFLANLYVTAKASALNLIMGPPGYGKSSVVTAAARALGHGNALLEIAVRRSWSDDRYLLGFYDTFHGRYDPGSTGLATRLLQAQHDWEQERLGLYFILLDEFNLAAPEYYFSELLQIVTRPPEMERRVRLFDPAALHRTAQEQADQIRLYPNVSFWGTINYDETTERLSPRLLDRTGMIFLTARDVLSSSNRADLPPPVKGVKASQVCQVFTRPAGECPDEHWELITPLLDFLKQSSEEHGPGIDLSPRVREGIRRYLANSKGLLTPAKAVDFVFQQRVLPVLRGRGPQFTARARALAEKLAGHGLDRSARHVQEALALADLNFGDLDFLAYQ